MVVGVDGQDGVVISGKGITAAADALKTLVD